ncbi:MAG TPA: urate hydroxylase PuuD, partial [Alphaproteobacteria bacterium]|nr:urate hydroxylase PuuD [Alphaproteobacteria bacterium]
IMAGNVFFIIIPNQKKTVAALLAGQAPDPALGKRAKQRSLHNNYLTLPVVLMMISNHYPMMFEHAQSWLIVAGILLFSGLLRLYANQKNAGKFGANQKAILLYALMIGMGAIGFASYRPNADLDAVGPVTLADVQAIMAHRCLACHSATPTDTAYKSPPKGIAFDTADQIRRMAPQIERMVVLTEAMPLANKTGMLPEERLVIAKWLADAQSAVD